jgi:hypothetical protein
VSVAPEAEQQDNTLAPQSTAAAADVEQRTAAPAAVLESAAPSVVQESTAPAAVQVSVAPEAEQQDNTLAPQSTAAAADVEQRTAAPAAVLASAAPSVVQESTAPAAVQGSAAPAAKLPAAVKRPSRGQSVGHTPNSDNSKKKLSLKVHAAISRGGARNPNQIDFGMGEPNIIFHQVRHCCLTIGCADFIAGQVLFPVQYCSVNERA